MTAPLYTLKIVVEDTDPLDGTTLLDIDGAGVTVDRGVTDRSITVTLPPGTKLGQIDPGQVIENQDASLNGLPMLMTAFQVSSSAPYSPGDGITLDRLSPKMGSNAGNAGVLSADLSDEDLPGQLVGPETFPVDHLLAISTGAVSGPHEIVMLLQCLDDAAAETLGNQGAASSSTSSGGGLGFFKDARYSYVAPAEGAVFLPDPLLLLSAAWTGNNSSGSWSDVSVAARAMQVKRVLLAMRTTTPPLSGPTESITVNLYADPAASAANAYPTTLLASVNDPAALVNGSTVFDFGPASIPEGFVYRLEVVGLSAISIINLNTIDISAGMEFEDVGP
jgi:hypothetical protein